MIHHKWKRDEADHFKETEPIKEETVEVGQASDRSDSQEKKTNRTNIQGKETDQQGTKQTLDNQEYSHYFL